MEKPVILAALCAWINKRPGIDPHNYFDPRDCRDKAGRSAYQADARRIAQQKRDALELLAAVEQDDSITGSAIVEAIGDAYSGRLKWDDTRRAFDYCTGQYFCTEYRAAAAAGLALALWRRWRDDLTEDEDANAIRRRAREAFGRGIASRWFG